MGKAADPVRGSRVSAAALRRATGRDRPAWFALLDAWKASTRSHRDIAAWLMREHQVPGWWAQTLTVDYEQARGLRKPGGKRDGTFEVGVSKTIAVSVARLYAAFVNPRARKRWLPDAVMRQRTALSTRTARFDWEDGATRVVVGFTPKGESKSQVAVVHERLPSAAAAARIKIYWRERLGVLDNLLERPPSAPAYRRSRRRQRRLTS
jgi:hypothetical protein